jgi:anionic cell wall polymer biosynthesis LytR-Cps2A-Psr (LCP) family protein
MNGRVALAYARTRRLDGDTARRHRHLDLLQAAITQARSVRSPMRLLRVSWTATRTIHLSVPLRHLVALARRGPPSRVQVRALEEPTITASQLPDGRYVQQGDPAEVAAFVRLHLGLP